MPPRAPLPEDIARGVLATLELPETGPCIVTLALDDPDAVPREAVALVARELNAIAPGRVFLAVLGPGATLASVTDEELDVLGLTRRPTCPCGDLPAPVAVDCHVHGARINPPE